MIFVTHQAPVNAPGVLGRGIDCRGQRFTGRITVEATHRVVSPGSRQTPGTIAGEIDGADHDLRLRSRRTLAVAGADGGFPAEREYADSMTGDYLKAVAATLNAMRRLAADIAAAGRNAAPACTGG